jgi:hypothetical protein
LLNISKIFSAAYYDMCFTPNIIYWSQLRRAWLLHFISEKTEAIETWKCSGPLKAFLLHPAWTSHGLPCHSFLKTPSAPNKRGLVSPLFCTPQGPSLLHWFSLVRTLCLLYQPQWYSSASDLLPLSSLVSSFSNFHLQSLEEFFLSTNFHCT